MFVISWVGVWAYLCWLFNELDNDESICIGLASTIYTNVGHVWIRLHKTKGHRRCEFQWFPRQCEIKWYVRDLRYCAKEKSYRDKAHPEHTKSPEAQSNCSSEMVKIFQCTNPLSACLSNVTRIVIVGIQLVPSQKRRVVNVGKALQHDKDWIGYFREFSTISMCNK